MAEKPRLKETDEIFSSVGKGAAKKAGPLPGVSPEDSPPPVPAAESSAPAAQPLIDSLLDSPESGEADSRRRRGRRRSEKQPAAEPKVDTRPLSFEKYSLPAKEEEQTHTRQKKGRGTGRDPETASLVTPPLPKMRRVSPPSAPGPELELPEAEAPPQEEAPASRAQSGQRSTPPLAEEAPPPVSNDDVEIKPFIFEELLSPDLEEVPPSPAEPAKPKIVRSGEREAKPAPREKTPPAAKGEEPAPPEMREPTPEELREKQREDFLKQLSSQFDEAFTSAFESKEEPPPRAWKKPRERARKPYDFEVIPKDKPALPPEAAAPEDREADREAESFLKEFEQKVREEEEVRTELFKDTLAEKFERERERYLQELGIDEDACREEEPEPTREPKFKPPSTRRLDLQIEPDMHRQPGEAVEGRQKKRPPKKSDGPVTYSRAGTLRSLEESPEEEELPAPAPRGPFTDKPDKPDNGADRKKTAEDLLLELGRQNTGRAPGSRPAPRAMEAPPRQAAESTIAFVHAEEEPEKPPRKGSKKIIAISALVAAMLLVVIALPWVSRLFPTQPAPPEGSQASTPAGGPRDETIYESRQPEVRQEYDNILVKKSGIIVKNMAAADRLVIQEIETPGEVILEDISVGSEIVLNNCAVDSLVLRNVSAKRLVISNNQAAVSISLSGSGSIDMAEIKSSATLRQIPVQGADGRSLQNVMLKAAPEVSVLNVTLSGMDLQTLISEDGAVLTLEDTTADLITCEGSLSLSGSGKALKMTVQPKELGETVVLSLGVPVSNLSLLGAGQLTVNSTIDTLGASEDMTISGTGTISNMILDAPISGHRLHLELADAGVGTLIANTETTLSVTGSGRVSELIANASVYALGNKVSLLKVNANQVIYENQPDKVDVTNGIRPPETVADNPNLDYDITISQQSTPPDTDLDDISTVCGHPRESGGFLKGDGSVSDPYQVSTPAQLAHVGAHLNSHFVQVGDIDIADDTQFVSGFPMIGEGAPFSGSYDGGGYAISNLRITSAAGNVGLFSENSGEVRNVHLRSGEVRGNAADRSFVGGIAGLNYQSGSISSCSNGARVIGSASSYVGGIVGYNYSAKIKDCYNAAKITGASNVGGLVGVNGDGASLSGSYNVGTIEGGSSDTGSVAGVNTSGGIVTNCYYLLDTSEKGIGTGDGSATQKDTDQMSAAQMVADLAAGNDASPWERSTGSYTYPVLGTPARPETAGSGTTSSTPEIAPP